MTCEEVREMMKVPIHLSTLAMRSAGRHHVQNCEACYTGMMSHLEKMIASGLAKPESIVRGVITAINDHFSEDAEAQPGGASS